MPRHLDAGRSSTSHGPVAAIALALLALLAFVGTACDRNRGREESSPPVPLAQQLARELAAARFADSDYAGARAALAPLVAAADAAEEDLVRAAVVSLALHDDTQAADQLERARKLRDDDPALWFNLGRVALANDRLEEATKWFRRAHELAPDDLFTQLALSKSLSDSDAPDDEGLLQGILARGVDHGGSVYVAALYRSSQNLIQHGKMDEARTILDEFHRLQDQGITAPTTEQIERGRFGLLLPPRPRSIPAARPIAPVAPLPAPVPLVALEGLRGIQPTALLDDRALGAANASAARIPDLVAWGEKGVALVTRGPDGIWSVRPIDATPCEGVRGLDLDHDGDLDLWVQHGAKLLLLLRDGDHYVPAPVALPELPSPPADFLPVDFDHEGDLDLFLVGPFGMRLWRDDGAAQGGKLTDVTQEAGLATGDAFTWCRIEDLDCDQDIDLIAGNDAGMLVADNLRGGKFALHRDVLPKEALGHGGPLFADLDADARPDAIALDRPANWWRGGTDFRFFAQTAASGTAIPSALRAGPVAADLDLDGALDGLALDRSAKTNLIVALALARPQAVGFAGPAFDEEPVALAVGDVDGDLVPDLLLATRRGVDAVRMPSLPHHAIRVALAGVKDNRRGVGAVVEVRAGDLYRRTLWDGEAHLLGLGAQAKADWLRVTWPNGVVQTVVDLAAGSAHVLEQKEGLVGSCPFLYTWNGRSYEFVTDVLGITPLGLPMEPDLLVPPDHDEFVLIRGEQLVPREGLFDLQFTEELREVTYLDRVRLDVVDHPAESEIYPNERFTFPPFPEPKTHVVVAPRAPRQVLGSDGKDWTQALRAIDGDLAAPFHPYRGTSPESPAWGGQFLGLAPPHWLELRFDPADVADAKLLRLVMTGWFYWTDASVNLASARTPSIRFEPPVLQVPDGKGGWRDAGPPIGFPAGKLKSMVIDVTPLLDRADPRLRLTSSLRLYWDSIRLAVDDGTTPARTTSVEPAGAELWQRGFSAPVELPGGHQLEWFDWNRLASEARWNQHPGLYTKLGPVLPLVTAIDDQFVVMGAGDALHLQFPAGALPPLPAGWRRDFLLFVDGWAKDRDLNTVDALHVEPLPFHAMTHWPYGDTQRFPDDAAHREWRARWLTRPARRWIEPLATVREGARSE